MEVNQGVSPAPAMSEVVPSSFQAKRQAPCLGRVQAPHLILDSILCVSALTDLALQ